jgi:hypothetical protein
MNSSNESDKYSNCYNEDFLSPAGWHTLVIPDTQEAEIKKITVQGQPGQKFSEIPSQQDKSSTVVSDCDPSYFWQTTGRRIMVQGQPQAKSKLI